MLSHYRLEMHTSFLKDPKATKRMTTKDKENLLEKHAGPVIAAAHAKFNAIDEEKIEAYWKQCGLDKKSWSQYNDAKSTTNPSTPKRKRKGSLGEDEFETYSKAFAAQRQNAARFEKKPLISPEKNPNPFRRIDSASPDAVQHKYALGMGYTHVSQRSPQASSRLRPHVQQPSPQPAASSFQTGGSSSHDSHQQPSNQAPQQNNSTSPRGASSHKSHQQSFNQARQSKSSSTLERSRESHQQPSKQSRQSNSCSTLERSRESHQQPSKQARQNNPTSTRGASSHGSHQQPPHQAQQKNPTSTTRGASHHDHQHPKPTPTAKATTGTSSSSSLGQPRHATLSGDQIANAHLSLPQMPPGVDSIFSLDRKRRDELQQQEREGRARKVVRREEEEEGGGGA